MAMKAKPKKKLCWNCEGSVSLQAENCPYCAVYLSPGNETKEDDLYSPPYSSQNESNQGIPVAPYAINDKASNDKEFLDAEVQETEENTLDEGLYVDQIKHVIQPLTLLLAGSVFFIFGITLLLFSHQGVFSLKWNGAYWYLYLLVSLPMLIFGWVTLQRLKDIDE